MKINKRINSVLKKKRWKSYLDKVFYDDEKILKMEECVLCHQMTDVPKDMPIDQRKYYMVGAGQLCVNCWSRLFPPFEEQY